MHLSLPYGSRTLKATWTGGGTMEELRIADAPALPDVAAAARIAMGNPIGMQHGLGRVVEPGDTVAIVVSDAFRRTGVDQYLPALLLRLKEAGIRYEDVSIAVATGTHRAPTPKETKAILGADVYDGFKERTFAHDAFDKDNFKRMGFTRRGTPVEINRRVRQCKRVIATGAAVLHYFGGFGGGRKSILPGIASAKTIAANHSLNLHPTEDRLDPDVRIGVLDNNPVAEDMLDGARLCGVDFIINTVLNQQGEVAGIFAGELSAAHRKAADFARELHALPIDQQANIVLASAGMAKNYIQSHKALFNAYQACKPAGRIIFACPAPEGLGSESFLKWIRLGNPEKIIAALRKKADINGQTALSTLQKAKGACFITKLPENDLACLGAERAVTLNKALKWAHAVLPKSGKNKDGPLIYSMPDASYTVPILRQGRPR
jgi:lactate racemase